MSEIISIVLSLIGIILTIYIYLRERSSTNAQSEFYAFKSQAIKRLTNRLRNLSYLCVLIVIIIDVMCFIQNETNILPISSKASGYGYRISTIVIILFLVVQIVTVGFLVYKKASFMDKIIEEGHTSIIFICEPAYYISIFIALIFAIITGACKFSGSNMAISALIAIMIIAAFEATYYFYTYYYIKLRTYCRVNKINIKVDYNNCVYEDVYNYEISNNKMVFTIVGEPTKEYIIATDRIEYVEKIIDESVTLLDQKLKELS